MTGLHHTLEDLGLGEAFGLGLAHHVEDPLVVVGHHLDEFGDGVVPASQQSGGDRRVGERLMASDDLAQLVGVARDASSRATISGFTRDGNTPSGSQT